MNTTLKATVVSEVSANGDARERGGEYLRVDGNRLFLAEGKAFLRYDISDPVHPVETGRYETEENVTAIDVEGAFACIMEKRSGRFTVLDVSDPAELHVVGSLIVDDDMIDIRMDGHLVLVTSYRGSLIAMVPSLIVDIGGPNTPAVVGEIEIDSYNYLYSDFSNGTAWIVDGSTLYTFSVDENGQVTPLGTTSLQDGADRVRIDGERAFVVNNTHLVHVMDISEPNLPEWTTSIEIGGIASQIEVRGNLLYVYDLFDAYMGLRIIDATIPESPTILNTIPLKSQNSGHFDILTDGKLAILSNGTYIYDPMVCLAP